MKNLLIILLLFTYYIGIGQAASSASIIGKPITIGNLVVAKNDFPLKMNWSDAKKVCANLGDGWRLPTKNELIILYQNKSIIGGFNDSNYWTLSEYDGLNAWKQNFLNSSKNEYLKSNALAVRAIKNIKIVSQPKKNIEQTNKTIIGDIIKIGNLEIAEFDFKDHMNWQDAKNACNKLGDGWRLPTINELHILSQNRFKIGYNWDDFGYWSETEKDKYNSKCIFFGTGCKADYPKSNALNVRAIRVAETKIMAGGDISIIGSTIKLGNLEIAQFDFPNLLDWNEAINACTELGDGWRLPSKDELIIMYKNKNKIGGFAENSYWTLSKDDGNYDMQDEAEKSAYSLNMPNGITTPQYKCYVFYARAIRSL